MIEAHRPDTPLGWLHRSPVFFARDRIRDCQEVRNATGQSGWSR